MGQCQDAAARESPANLSLTPGSSLLVLRLAQRTSSVGVGKTDGQVRNSGRLSVISAGAEAPHWFSSANQPNQMNLTRLFVGNLSYQTMANDLQDYFSQAGVVRSTDVMFDKFTGKSRGFAFVEMSTPEEANKAVEMFHNKELQGRQLTVNIARPKEDRPPRGEHHGHGRDHHRDSGRRDSH